MPRIQPYCLLSALKWALLACCLVGQLTAEEIEIRAVEGLKFEPVRLRANAGEKLNLRIINSDANDLPHNFVIGQPGSLKKLVSESLALGAEGPASGFVPDLPEVLAASGLLTSGEEEQLAVQLPEKPGVYPYVCTFPGHGYVMYGALYVDVEMPPADEDPHIPKLVAHQFGGDLKRPAVQRVFMPGAGPAAIAVALPNDQNYCWDAGACRLRYAWPGEFVDAERHFEGNGSALAKLPDKRYWRALDDGYPIRLAGESHGEPSVKFRGYRLISGRPRFEYEIGGVTVFEFLEELPTGNGLRRHFEIPEVMGDIFFRTASEKGRQTCSSGKPEQDGWIRLNSEEAKSFSVEVHP